MWLENLKELKVKTGMSAKQIADKTNIPQRTIERIFAGETDHPYADTLDIIVKALGADLGDIFTDTKVIVATDELVGIKESVDVVEAERDLTLVENEMLKAKNAALTTEVELLKKELQHKDEIIALHNYYKSLISGMTKENAKVEVL
jgi:transcriptional regulator with XRE-family HTH domain